MYRKCCSSCQKSISSDRRYIRAYIVHGKALQKLGKSGEAIKVWQSGLSVIEDDSDAMFKMELNSLLGISNSMLAIDLFSRYDISSEPYAEESLARTYGSATSLPIEENFHSRSKSTDLTLNQSFLSSIHMKYFIEERDNLNPAFLEAIRNNLAHASGEGKVDDLISTGYLRVNTGQYDKAIEIFSKLLEYRNDLIGPYLGIGSALALSGDFDNAILAFTAAININPTIADSWKRRGQTRGAKNLLQDSISDFNRAIALDPEADTYLQRGTMFHKARNFYRALLDFRVALDKGEQSANIYNLIGMCEGQLGNIEASLSAYKIAVTKDPQFKEAALNYAQMLKEIGSGEESEKAFQALIDGNADGKFFQAYSYRASLRHGLGQHKLVLEDLSAAMNVMYYWNNSNGSIDLSVLSLRGMCLFALGLFPDAVQQFDDVLHIDPDHHCWGFREVVLYCWHRLFDNLQDFSLDTGLDPRVKEACCKKQSARVALLSGPPHKCIPIPEDHWDLDRMQELSQSNAAAMQRVLQSSKQLEHFVQLRSPGFLPNARQHRMFGISVLQMSVKLRRHTEAIRNQGTGLLLQTSRSSNPQCVDTVGEGMHVFGYRDFFDVAVLWRQLSEPNDAVWWIDGLTRAAFEEGFGLQTPIVNGQLKTIRYYSYFQPAFALMKDILLDKGYFNAANVKLILSDGKARQAVYNAVSLQDIFNVVNQDFYVVTTCRSLWDDSLELEGTRLTLVQHAPEGFEFTIRTAGTPARWSLLDKELRECFNRLVEAILLSDESVVLRRALELFYFWVNFAPLSRGSAVCGYAALSASLLCGGWLIAESLPTGIQLDWEAILAPSLEDFINKAIQWLVIVPAPSTLVTVDVEDAGLDTIHGMFNFLNL